MLRYRYTYVRQMILVVSAALCSLTKHLFIADILRALDHKLDSNWQEFGTFLSVEYRTIKSIEIEERGKLHSCMLHLVGSWIDNEAGTGHLPRTWETVSKAVREAREPKLAMEIAEKHGVTLTQQ